MKAKIIGGILGLVVLILVGGSIAASMFLDQEKYKGIIVSKVAEATGYTIDWQGKIKIALAPVPHVSLDNVSAKNGSKEIANIESLNIDVSLGSLLKGQVGLGDVTLKKPVITLAVDKAGNQSWMNDKLAKKDTAEAPQEETASPQKETAASSAITFGKIIVKDGSLTYTDAQKGSEQIISKIDVAVEIGNDNGPYVVEGNLAYNDIAFTIDAKTSKPNDDGQLPLQVKAEFPDLKAKGEYSGIIKNNGSFTAEGDLNLSVDNIEKTVEAFTKQKSNLPKELAGSASVEGTLSYAPDAITIKNAKVSAGSLSYLGEFSVTGLQTAERPVIGVNFQPAQGNQTSTASSPLIAVLDDLTMNGKGSMIGKAIVIEEAAVKFDGTSLRLAGRYDPPAKSDQKGALNVTLTSPRIDLDDLARDFGKETTAAPTNDSKPSAQKAADVKETAKGINLPVDATVDVNVGEVVYQGQSYTNVAVKGALKADKLDITNLSLGMKPSATLSANGSIGALSSLSGIDMTAKVSTSDTDALLKALKVEQKAIKKPIGAGSVTADLTGSIEKLGFDATVQAMEFQIAAKGTVDKPLEKPIINSVDLQVNHPQFVNAMRTLQPSFDAGPSLRGPLNVGTAISWADNKYHAGAIKGKIGTTDVNGDIYFDSGAGKPSITGQLNFGALVLGNGAGASSAAPAGKGGAAPGQQTQSAESRWSREAIDVSWMNNFNADIAIKAQSLVYDLWNLTQPSLAFKLQNGTLDIAEAKAGLFGGTASITGQVKAGASVKDPLSMNWVVTTDNLNANQLHSAIVRKRSDFINGTINNFDMNMSSAGVSPAALVYALTGKGSMDGKNLIVKGIDAAQLAQTAKGSYKPLERAGSLLTTFQSGQTEFSEFNAAFDIQNGVVQFSKIFFDGPKASIEGTGNVNLPQWTVDLKNKMTVKGTDIPPFDIAIKGPLDNPAQAGGAVIEDYLRSKVENKVQKLIGKELEKRFGIPQADSTPATAGEVQPTPTATDDAAQPVEPAPQEQDPEKVMKKEAIKALEGLFAR